MNWKHLLCIGLVGLMLVAALACGETAKSTEANSQPTAAAADTGSETVSVNVPDEKEVETATAVPTPEPTETPTPTPTPEPTPTPTPTPVPTREPMEGDIVLDYPDFQFPDYDTGVDADYSYQSDELRVAIKVVEDEENYQKYYVADVWIRNIAAFRTGFGHGRYRGGWEDPVPFATREHAIFAANGSANSGFVLHNGVREKEYSSALISEGDGLMCMYTDGSMKAVNLNYEKWVYKEENAKKEILNVWHVGPTLVQNGEMNSELKHRARHPRTILGYYEPGHYVIVVCEGRRKNAIGMTDLDMGELMASLGVQEAVNLDGGDSTYMVFMGEVINTPSSVDNNKDGSLDRKLFDMLLFAEYDADGNAPALTDVDTSKIQVKANEE